MAFLLTLSSSSNPTNKPITMVPCLLFFTSILHLLVHFLSFFLVLYNDSSTIIKTNKGERSIEEKLEILKMQSDDLGISVGDVKKQLQKYARQRNFGLPVYFCECDQCPEATQFMATVTVGDQIFESSGSFNTSKDAESDTAKVALMSFLMENFQEASTPNFSEECLEWREDLSTPVYKTIKRGEPHKPIFFTSVELDGEIFHGKAAKSKKQAELDAARAAYVALQERGSIQNVNFTSSSLGAHTPKSTWSSCVAYDLGQSLKHQCILVPHQPQIYVEAKEKFGTLADSAETTVFVDPSRDESLIFEILELKEEVGDDGSASWFLQDLASEQESEGCVVIKFFPIIVHTH
ncbi:hypothetical protein G4B88_003382 [Cannabis sativa]|uniref:DRBM domain-containing protein n=1 Tax=Cannabis sativa TaxID=3483 RepID=A0A7J6ERZ8_CANSA|nr:hypothetical protein G4B88_003382 [Cannabis sativa]